MCVGKQDTESSMNGSPIGDSKQPDKLVSGYV